MSICMHVHRRNSEIFKIYTYDFMYIYVYTNIWLCTPRFRSSSKGSIPSVADK